MNAETTIAQTESAAVMTTTDFEKLSDEELIELAETAEESRAWCAVDHAYSRWNRVLVCGYSSRHDKQARKNVVVRCEDAYTLRFGCWVPF